MNIEDALLTRRLLRALTGAPGKTHPQLANECRVGQRRMTNLIFCLEKAGLVTTHDSGRVTLADALADLAIDHARGIRRLSDKKQPAFTFWWAWLIDADRLKSSASQADTDNMFGNIFNEIFGGSRK